MSISVPIKSSYSIQWGKAQFSSRRKEADDDDNDILLMVMMMLVHGKRFFHVVVKLEMGTH